MSDISLQNVPMQLGQVFGITTFAGGILASLVVVMFVLVLILFTFRGRGGSLPAIVGGVGTMAFCVSLGWLGYWVLLIVVLTIALFFSGTIRDWVSGRGG